MSTASSICLFFRVFLLFSGVVSSGERVSMSCWNFSCGGGCGFLFVFCALFGVWLVFWALFGCVLAWLSMLVCVTFHVVKRGV